MKKSRKQKEIEARKAADPLAQALGRDDIDYESDELPTAPRFPARDPGVMIESTQEAAAKHCETCRCRTTEL